MATAGGKPRVIALEEHYLDAEVASRYTATDMGPPALRPSLDDLGVRRLQEMDEAGIDLQVISHGAPGLQRVDDASAVSLARRANDRLREAVAAHPDRFAAFAVLPTADPAAAAGELERCVAKLGFRGAMLHGIAHGRFLDDSRFLPIYERAQALDVPVYVHPATPHPSVIDAYYRDYAQAYPGLITAAWGFTVETATQGIRLVLSGLFETLPRLKIILGHLGESLPFSLWRIDKGLSRHMGRPSAFRDCFREHFYVTTSGNFSTPALRCCIEEMGIERVLFSVDWPYASNAEGTRWMRDLPLPQTAKEQILGGNAAALLRL